MLVVLFIDAFFYYVFCLMLSLFADELAITAVNYLCISFLMHIFRRHSYVNLF